MRPSSSTPNALRPRNGWGKDRRPAASEPFRTVESEQSRAAAPEQFRAVAPEQFRAVAPEDLRGTALSGSPQDPWVLGGMATLSVRQGGAWFECNPGRAGLSRPK